MRENFAVLPLVANYDFKEGALFPLFWWKFRETETMHTLFPLYYYEGTPDSTSFLGCCGLFGYFDSPDEGSRSWLLPLYGKFGDDFYSIPYSHEKMDDGGERNLFLLGIGGYESDAAGSLASNWLFPIWSVSTNTFSSLLFTMRWDDAGEPEYWRAPLLLSGGTRKPTGWVHRYLLGLAGSTTQNENGASSSWLFPLYYADDDKFLSLPISFGRNDGEGSVSYWSLPLLSRYKLYDSGESWLNLLLLYGHYSDSQGRTINDFLFPMYSYDSKSGNFISWIYSHINLDSSKGEYSCYWWLTPLFGTLSGTKSGCWLFPLFSYTVDDDLDKRLACLDAKSLDKSVCTPGMKSEASGSFLLFADFDHSVSGEPCIRRYSLKEKIKRGNRLIFNHSFERTVTFNIDTCCRIGESVDTETMALLGAIYHSVEKIDTARGTHYSRSRLLWKFWDREEIDGNVSLDMFPGISYDSKKNGSTKLSLLGRLFRYESDPEKGTAVEFLFIPVRRR